MKVIITGSTGMVGKGVLLECLDHPAIDQVLVINRRSLDMQHPKLREIIHQDFSSFTSISDQLSGYDAAYLCMGVSSAGKKEEEYYLLTFGYTMALAQELTKQNANMVVTYVSGEGTDSTEKGNTMWARVKGKTENKLKTMGFSHAYMFRPGIIIPLRGIRSSTKLYQFFYDYFMWMIKIIRAIAPKAVVNTTDIGLAMIEATINGYDKWILRPSDILILSERGRTHIGD